MRKLFFLFFIFVSLTSMPTQAFASVCFCYFGENNDCQPVTIDQSISDYAAACISKCQTTYQDALKKSDSADHILINATKEMTCSAAHTDANPSLLQPVQEAVVPKLSLDTPAITFSPILEQKGLLEINFLGEYIQGMYKYLIKFSFIIAIVLLMIGGLQWALGAASSEQLSKAKKRIKDAVTGLVLLLSVVLILQIVNPQLILMKSLELHFIQPIHINTEGTDRDLTSDDISTPGTAPAGSKVPMFKQGSYAQTPFGICGTIATSGCGPTSAAMVIKYWQNQGKVPVINVDPKIMGDLIAQKGYRGCLPACTSIPEGYKTECGGMVHKALSDPAILSQFGLIGSPVGKTEAIITTYLKSGNPIIVSVEKSIFTDYGHFIVLADVDAMGNIIVNDPNKNSYKLKDGTEIKNGHVPPNEIFPYIGGAFWIHPKE